MILLGSPSKLSTFGSPFKIKKVVDIATVIEQFVHKPNKPTEMKNLKESMKKIVIEQNDNENESPLGRFLLFLYQFLTLVSFPVKCTFCTYFVWLFNTWMHPFLKYLPSEMMIFKEWNLALWCLWVVFLSWNAQHKDKGKWFTPPLL